MSDRGKTEILAAIFKPAIRAIHPPERMQRARRVEAAITEDGRVSDYALSGMLGHLVATWFISGTQSVANTVGMEYRVGADGVIERFDIRVKTAPTGQALKVRINRNGVALVTATIAAGSTSTGLPVNAACNAGDVLTIDVTQVGSGTAGSSLTASATMREERGN